MLSESFTSLTSASPGLLLLESPITVVVFAAEWLLAIVHLARSECKTKSNNRSLDVYGRKKKSKYAFKTKIRFAIMCYLNLLNMRFVFRCTLDVFLKITRTDQCLTHSVIY